MKTLTMRCKAFKGEVAKEHKIEVGEDGTVRVWDEIAGYYTTVHSMSKAQQTRARKLAQ